jgi:hypothetical protein
MKQLGSLWTDSRGELDRDEDLFVATPMKHLKKKVLLNQATKMGPLPSDVDDQQTLHTQDQSPMNHNT